MASAACHAAASAACRAAASAACLAAEAVQGWIPAAAAAGAALPPAAAAGAALLWAQGLAPGRPEDLSGSEEVEPGCPYPPSAQVAPFPHRRPACPRDAAGRLEAGGAAASLAVAPQVAPTQGNRAVPMASARSAAQAPQPRPSGAALALLELLVPQPLRAEPRQHDLSLGTAVKICTNTDLPRTQPGDTAARQRERETCRVGTDHASYCQQCPRNPEVVGHPGTHDGRA